MNVERLGLTLIHTLWEGAIIAAVYAAVRMAGARALSPRGRYFLACTALAAMALAPAATWIALRPTGPEAVAASFMEPLSTQRTASPLPLSLLSHADTYPRPQQPFLSWVVLLWLTGATAFSLRLLGGWIMARRLRSRLVRPAPAEWQRTLDRLRARMSVSAPVRLIVSGVLHAPAATGWLRPIVLAPAGALTGLPPEQMQALLLHELAHIRRYDYLVEILQNLIEAVFFYHPAVWWISGDMRAERELCCDDMVVAVTGDAELYARALAEFDAAQWAAFPALSANGGSLVHRVARLLGQTPPSRSVSLGPASALAPLLLAVGAWAVFAQAADSPRFEVASIKPSFTQTLAYVRPVPGRLTADATLQTLMQYAYGAQPFQIVGGPDLGRYRIEAKAEGNPRRDRIFAMLQTLLEDRFQLRIHHEMKEQPVYELRVAKGGLKLPPPKERTCDDSAVDAAGEWVGGRMAPPGTFQIEKPRCGSAVVSLRPQSVRLEGGKIAMPELVRVLSRMCGRGVIDKTGFTGSFDLQLDFVADEITESMPPPPPGSGLSGPSIAQALREKLGIQMESARGPVDVIVIDHAERPAAN